MLAVLEAIADNWKGEARESNDFQLLALNAWTTTSVDSNPLAAVTIGFTVTLLSRSQSNVYIMAFCYNTLLVHCLSLALIGEKGQSPFKCRLITELLWRGS